MTTTADDMFEAEQGVWHADCKVATVDAVDSWEALKSADYASEGLRHGQALDVV
jgi:hypothetical protein